MKKLTLIIAAALVIALAMTGCVRVDRYQEDGTIDTRTYNLEDFTRLKVGNAFHLEVIPSDDYSITITAGENVLDKLDVSVVGETLVIDIDGWWFNIHKAPEAVITMPVLTGLELSGASRTTALGFETDRNFDLEISGASRLEMDLVTGDMDIDISGASRISGALVSGPVDMEVSGASRVYLEGSGGNTRMDVSGASQVDTEVFAVDDADVEVSGASTVQLNVNGRLDFNISGASQLYYRGDPTLVNTSVTGGSSVSPQGD